ASHARLSTGCLLGFAGSGLSPDYTIHAELAHNLRTLRTQAGQSLEPFPYYPTKKPDDFSSGFFMPLWGFI
ncbi:hypothetical protein, partial [uncultured Dialister sp.]|uniref:hypothetical protein n=1 Tax=uncultured Dialister sp. TaxID=278064 RepID=UPI0027DB6831